MKHLLTLMCITFIVVFTSTALGDAFDQTVEQIKTLEAELEQNRETALQEIEDKVAAERETNPLNAPKDQFESDADYQARLGEFEGVLSKIHSDVWGRYLGNNKTRKTEVGRLYNRIFEVNNLSVTLGTYDANDKFFPITVEVPLNDESQQRSGRLPIGKDDARELFNNWDQVIKTGYLSIGTEYHRNLVGLKLEIPNLSQELYFTNNNHLSSIQHLLNQTPNIISETSPYWAWQATTGIANPHGVSISPNGKYIAITDSEYAHLWRMNDHSIIWRKDIRYWGPAIDSRDIGFSPNGEYLVFNGQDRDNAYVGIFRTLNGHEVKRSYHHNRIGIRGTTYSPNGQYVAVAEDDDRVRDFVYLWNLDNDQRFWWGHSDVKQVLCVSFSPNGEYLAIGSNTGMVVLWIVSTWWTGRTSKWLEVGGNVRAVTFSPNGKYLVADGVDSSNSYVTFWDVSSGEKILQMQTADDPHAIAFSPNGEYLAVGFNNGVIVIYRIGAEEIIPTTDITRLFSWDLQDEPIRDLVWSPYGNYISNGSVVIQTILHPEVHNLDSEIMVEPAQQTVDVVRLTPATLESPPIGTQLSLNIDIVGAQNIAGYQATVQFDTTALQYVESSNGDYLPSGAFFISPIVSGNTGNTITLSATSLAGESSGDGTLATITFEVIDAKASTVNLFDVLLTDKDGSSSTPQIENAKITEPPEIPRDVNRDGVVNVLDLSLVASNFGKRGENVADVNNDGIVNVIDLTLVAAAFGNTAADAAPALWSLNPDKIPTRASVEQWLNEARQLDLTDPDFQRGILVLENLLKTLTPKETALLPNYPNPFNPETWIPYQLAKPAEVTLTIYALNGTVVRTLTLGHQPVGIYQSKSHAAYWDGRNAQGELVASGIYFYTLTADDFTATRKLLIQK